MAFGEFILRLLFLLQTGFGVLGNAFVLAVYFSMSYTSHASRPTHLILINMAVGNFLILLFKGIPHSIYIWGITHALGNHACEVALYMHKVGQSLSLCSTCLLSNFQAIAISPRVSGWMRLKGQAWKISVSCFLCWISSLMINIFGPGHTEGFQHMKNSTKKQDYGLCSSQVSITSEGIYKILTTLSDFILIGLMVGASVYMVLLLYRHQQSIRHFSTFSISHRLSSETKVTHSILLLTTIFILLYFTKSILTLDNADIFESHYWMQHVTTFLATCYPTLSPLVLILQDHHFLTFCS